MDTDLKETLRSAVTSFRSAIQTMAEVGAMACPPAAEHLKRDLLQLNHGLTSDASASEITETERSLELKLKDWGQQAAVHYTENTDHLKQLLLLVAKAADDVGERDKRYSDQFHNLAARLQGAAKLDDLSAIRQSLTQGAQDLQACVDRMNHDGQTTFAGLRAQLAAYEVRLAAVERIASLDELTGIPNRRYVEHELEKLARAGAPFSVIFLDINRFKQLNDTHGHLAGDDLLKQFAGELKLAFQSGDVIGRWGGDEFIGLVKGDPAEASSRIARVGEWVNGEYTVPSERGPVNVLVSAACGSAAWKKGETITSLLRRADTSMYGNKAQMARKS